MRKASKHPIAAADSTKENHPMSKRLASLLAAASLIALVILPIASAKATSPWWQVLDGSRPSHLWEPKSNVQEIETHLGVEFGEEFAVIGVEVEGTMVGCLGLHTFFSEAICEFVVGFPARETAAEFESLLESAFGTSTVDVTGGPVGGAPLVATTVGRSAPAITLKPFVGSGTSRVIEPGGSGRLVLTITNLGDAPVDGTETPVRIVDELPEGVVATGAEAFAGRYDESGPVECAVNAPNLVECTFEGTLPPYETIEVEVPVSTVGDPPAAGAPGSVKVSGGNAPTATGTQTIEVSPDPVPFGIERFFTQAEEEGGAPSTQAGAHPFQLVNTIQLNAGVLSPGVPSQHRRMEEQPLPRNLRFPLPIGFVGNANAMPTCAMVDFLALLGGLNDCPPESAIGVASVTFIERLALGFARMAVPVFNLPPAPGEPARFGFMVEGVPVLIDTAVDPGDGYRITAATRNTTQIAQFLSATTTLWGAPGDPRHDSSRGWACTNRVSAGELGPCERPPNLPETAFLRQPVSCDGPLDFDAELEPWNVPVGSVVDRASFAGAALHGCNKVPLDPKIAASPTSKLAANPSGLDFLLDMPNFGLLNPEAISEGHAKKISVTLPEGMTVNPSQAEGLAICSPVDYAREAVNSKVGEGCPEASKIGEVSVMTPLLDEEAKGALYIAEPYNNPFDSLLALYLVARIPERGIVVKLAGRLDPDPRTGQLITTFDDLPQLPFSSFKLHFREGGRSPLITPPGCGTFETVARFVPWSATNPDTPMPSEVVTRTSSFEISRGVDGGACPSGPAPFNPGFTAGTLNNAAGSYSPFYMRLTRGDGEQDLTRFSSILPPGVVGKLAGVAYCPEAGIAQAQSRTGEHGGTQELADPSCPSASQIGRTVAGAGVGNQLTFVKGSLYLAGPYKGAPLSVVAVTPAVAGPFDAGTIVVREALTLNPQTAEVEVDGSASDPIPHILQGIPLNVRDLRVYVDRSQFILNATSCERSSARATLWGGGTPLAPSIETPVELSSRYQAADCASLGFRPKLKLNLKGGTKRGDFPGLRATLKAKGGDANIAAAQVTLPRSAFLEQGHIGTICTRVQFREENCPEASIYGHAKAITPLLDEPVEGKVYLRSSDNKLPDLVIALKGIVDVNVVSRIDSFKGGLRSTFDSVPDAPISSFVLRMKGGKQGLIVNSRNLCAGKNRAKVAFTGHNGKVAKLAPEMKPQCGKARKKKR
jgi:hypothetical protein